MQQLRSASTGRVRLLTRERGQLMCQMWIGVGGKKVVRPYSFGRKLGCDAANITFPVGLASQPHRAHLREASRTIQPPALGD